MRQLGALRCPNAFRRFGMLTESKIEGLDIELNNDLASANQLTKAACSCVITPEIEVFGMPAVWRHVQAEIQKLPL